MRRINLITAEVIPPGGSAPVAWNYARAIVQILEAKDGGLKLAELRQCARIADLFEAAEKAGDASILLEEADWNYLAGRVHDHTFPFAAQAFVRLADEILDAKTYAVPPPAPEPPGEPA